MAESSAVIDRANQILLPWLAGASGKAVGTWAVSQDGSGWRLESPPELSPYLEAWAISKHHSSVENVVKAVEFQATAAAVLDPDTPLGFHAALLSLANYGGIAIVGEKEAGKSTLSVALWQAGFTLISDDGFFVDRERFSVRPVPRRCRLREPSRQLFSESFWLELAGRPTSHLDADGSLLFHPDPSPDQVKLRGIIILSAEPGELEPLTEADGLLDLVKHVHRHNTDGVRATLLRLAPLSNQVPCYRLGRGTLESRVAQIRSLSL